MPKPMTGVAASRVHFALFALEWATKRGEKLIVICWGLGSVPLPEIAERATGPKRVDIS